jgi:hypothetical protein
MIPIAMAIINGFISVLEVPCPRSGINFEYSISYGLCYSEEKILFLQSGDEAYFLLFQEKCEDGQRMGEER